jgi:hypothetical protein
MTYSQNYSQFLSKNTKYKLFICVFLFIYLTLFILGKQVMAYNGISHQSISNHGNLGYLILFIIFIVIAYNIWKLKHRTKKRRSFSADIKRQILINQNNKCAICKRNKGVWDYDHKDGNRSNNKISNCQALCPICHAKKTRGLLKVDKKPKFKWILVLLVISIVAFLYSLNR